MTVMDELWLPTEDAVRSRLRNMLERVFHVAEERHIVRIGRAVTLLVASYPDVRPTPELLNAYVSALDDLPAPDVEHACEAGRRTKTRLPRIAELRELAIEHQLSLPRAGAALELVERWVAQGAAQQCETCGGTGGLRGENERELELMTESEGLQEIVSRIKEAGFTYTTCPDCAGTGKAAVEDRKPLPAPARRALNVLGGEWAWRTTENLGVMRGQFTRLYDEFLREELAGPMRGRLS
jgi:hypothetical protein